MNIRDGEQALGTLGVSGDLGETGDACAKVATGE